jgi:N-acylneuraminate cytidylyltransferase/CMP-N,N'-diacetyllegionaminic acid synthase
MYKGKSILGLIPARSGSKRLLRKNVRLLMGKPLIAWTIEQALASRYLDRIVVSTDDQDIANISTQYGADVPFLRPKILATDNAKSIDVILHAMNWMEGHDRAYDLLMLLQPTSPLRTKYDIDNAIKLLFRKKALSIISVCEVGEHPLWSNSLPKNGSMKNFIRPELINKSKQDLPKFYRLNGAIYLAFWNYLKKEKRFLGNKSFAYIMPRERSVDIDEEIDLIVAEAIKRQKK